MQIGQRLGAQITLVLLYFLEVRWNRHQCPKPIRSMLYADISKRLMKSEKMRSNAIHQDQSIQEIQVKIVKTVRFFLICLF